MMAQLSFRRRMVVLVFSAVACMGTGPILLKHHPVLVAAWIAVMAAGLVFGIVEFTKLRKEGRLK